MAFPMQAKRTGIVSSWRTDTKEMVTDRKKLICITCK